MRRKRVIKSSSSISCKLKTGGESCALLLFWLKSTISAASNFPPTVQSGLALVLLPWCCPHFGDCYFSLASNSLLHPPAPPATHQKDHQQENVPWYSSTTLAPMVEMLATNPIYPNTFHSSWHSHPPKIIVFIVTERNVVL